MKKTQRFHAALAAVALAAAASGALAQTDDFADTFRNPPRTAKPHTWYHMMNGNVTKEGITCDFEALAKAGIGGVQMFDAGCNIPAGPLNFNSPEWFDLLKHAASEAKRLGLEICIPNCSGWSSSGGPWLTPDKGMKFFTTSVTELKGGVPFKGVLPRRTNDNGFYEDVAVVAYPVPVAETRPLPQVKVEKKGDTVVLSSESAFAAAGLAYAFDFKGWSWSASGEVAIEVSDDGATFRPLKKVPVTFFMSGAVDSSERTVAFPAGTRAKAIRAKVTSWNRSLRDLGFRSMRLTNGRRLADVAPKTFAVRMETRAETLPAEPDQVVRGESVLNVTDKMAPDGTFEWTPPEGRWRVIRLGMYCNGRHNHPASKFGVGLEVDKLSASAMDFHFEQYVARLCEHLGDLAGGETGFNNILVDSFEVGSQNWTQGLEKEFLKRKGYAMMPWYPALTGMIVDSVEQTERFLEDYRRVVADLFAENYAGELTKKCHEHGLLCSIEPYGNSPSDNLQYGQCVDVPMGEFWSSAREARVNYSRNSTGNAAFAGYIAHVWGRRYAATESFTASPESGGRWQTTPYSIKSQGDFAYCAGINRIIYHRFCHQPWAGDKYLPGMTMGKWGMHLDRTQTWWDYAEPWFTYQTRCQWMLQEGTFVADALFFCGEQAPNQGGNSDGNGGANGGAFTLPDGYRWDIAPTDAILQSKVENGLVVAPGGVAYRFLVLPEEKAMSPKMLRKIDSLLAAGATVVARVKPTRALGRSNYPACDEEVRALADAVWAKGVLRGTATEALRMLGIAPDVAFVSPLPHEAHVNFIHRRGRGADWYFVVCATPVSADIDVSFRITGLEPELWDAETGKTSPAPIWRDDGLRTRVRLPMRPCGSVFVVFRSPAKGDHAISMTVAEKTEPEAREAEPALEIVEAQYGAFESVGGEAAANLRPVKVVDIAARLRAKIVENRVRVSLNNALAGCDPVLNQVKKGRIRYRFGDEERTLVLTEGEQIELPPGRIASDRPLPVFVRTKADGALAFDFTAPATATIAYASGKTSAIAVDEVPAAAVVKGEWRVAFPAGFAPNKLAVGPDEEVVFPALADWTANANEGVKFFSGTATYRKTVSAADIGRVRAGWNRVVLDLGEVKHFAEVKVNGRAYPVLWRPPFRLDVTDALDDGGDLDLEVKVTNLWPNRLIGDDFKPEDCEWKKAEFREAIVKLPDWVEKGEKSPTGRFTFTTWKHWNKTDSLLPSGLIGPVRLCPIVERRRTVVK